jgi:RNA polymerase sigma-70 factor (ECF subfamily)
MLVRLEEREWLARALARLSQADREVLILRDLEGLSGEETAAALGVTVRAMKSRLHRARLRLAAQLREGRHAGA